MVRDRVVFDMRREKLLKEKEIREREKKWKNKVK